MQQSNDAALKVLVVDDDPQIRQLLERVLGNEGFSVHTAKAPDEALATLRTTKFEAVVLDIRMPDSSGAGRTGIDVLGFMRKNDEFRSIPVLILTGEVLTDAEEKAILGLEAYVINKSEGHQPLLQYLKHLTAPRKSSEPGTSNRG